MFPGNQKGEEAMRAEVSTKITGLGNPKPQINADEHRYNITSRRKH
jgi:hypothetical protein